MYLSFAVLSLAYFQGPGSGTSLLSGCTETASVLAILQRDAALEVSSSRTSGDDTCYAVSTIVNGAKVKGYVLGAEMTAIREYESRRRPVPTPAPSLPAAVVAPPAPPINPPLKQPSGPPFADFVATDMKRRTFNIHGFQSKVTLICFWDPYNKESQRELLLVSRIGGQLKQKGVENVSVVLSGEREKIEDILEDFHTIMPTVPNGSSLAARYGVTAGGLPRTFVLNERHEVVASNLHGKELEDMIRTLVQSK